MLTCLGLILTGTLPRIVLVCVLDAGHSRKFDHETMKYQECRMSVVKLMQVDVACSISHNPISVAYSC